MIVAYISGKHIVGYKSERPKKFKYQMTKLFLFILLFTGQFVSGQDTYPTKSQLTKSLTKKTELKGKVYNSTNWFTIESDSAYRNIDTLVFYNNSNYRYGKLICNFVDWNFYKKNAFWVQHVQLCKEPTTATAIKDRDFFTFDLSDKEHPMIIRIFNKGKLVDTFEVLSLTKQPLNSHDNEKNEVLTLHRIKASAVEH